MLNCLNKINKLARLTLYHEYQYIYQLFIETKDKKGMIKFFLKSKKQAEAKNRGRKHTY